MSEIKDGGPAFPVKPYSTDARNWSDGSEGMTLRDYFAAKAMAGELASQNDQYCVKTENMAEHADRWYAIADAMLAEKDEPKGE